MPGHSVSLGILQMAYKPPVGKPGQEEEVAQVHRIRITLTSRNVKNLEKGAHLEQWWCSSLKQPAVLSCRFWAEGDEVRHEDTNKPF